MGAGTLYAVQSQRSLRQLNLYQVKFYKNMAKLVVEPLTRMYAESFERGTLPQTLNLANIHQT